MRPAGSATAERHARYSTTVLFLSVVLTTVEILAARPAGQRP